MAIGGAFLSFDERTDQFLDHTAGWLNWLRSELKNNALAEQIFYQTLCATKVPSYAHMMGRIACLVSEIKLAHLLGQRFVGIEEDKARGPYLTYLRPNDAPPELWLDLRLKDKAAWTN